MSKVDSDGRPGVCVVSVFEEVVRDGSWDGLLALSFG
jgi:hypothetical protein